MAEGSGRKVVIAALIGNALIAATKLAAGLFTGSSAMLSEAAHSLVDTCNEVLLLYGMRRASRPATLSHPYGFGREIYFWGFVVAVLIFGLGAGWSVYEGVRGLAAGRTGAGETDALVNYVVLGVSALFEGGSFYVGAREFNRARGERRWYSALRRSKDPAVFVALLEDTAALVGLAIAFAGVGLAQWTGNPAFDASASILIGIVLAAVAIFLAQECKGLLLGESADPAVIDGIVEIALANRRVHRVVEVLTTHFGPEDVLLNLGVELRDGLSGEEMEAAVVELEAEIRNRFPVVRRVFIEVAGFPAHPLMPPVQSRGGGGR